MSWFVLCESFSRIAFPIFCFLLVEGFAHTRDRLRYGINLLIFAILSEPIFDLSRTLMPFDPTYQNVFVTLFASYLGLCALEGLRDRPALRAFSVIGLAFVPINLYNGRRGFIRGPVLKYAFYAFYPLHLLVLWRLRVYLGF